MGWPRLGRRNERRRNSEAGCTVSSWGTTPHGEPPYADVLPLGHLAQVLKLLARRTARAELHA